ncbi:MAG: hypothetical protein K2V38_07485 [Gemmataceae bacterium]|nr:hypothetical protein [Gemmataceae bacterium]
MEWYPPKSGKWEDARFELGWVDGGIGMESYRPHLVFNSHEGFLFDAIMRPDPAACSDSLNSTLDSLLYVRDNVSRLLRVIQKRIELLNQHGLAGNYPALSTQLRQLDREYRHAGAGADRK